MKIEILKGREIKKTRALYEEVFQDSKEYTDYFYEKAQKEGTAFAVEKDGEVAAEMFLLPKILVSGDRRIEALYLYGVATKKEYRRQGLMDRLIKEALCCAENSGAELLYLIPVSPVLYERYGFCTMKQREVRIWEISEREGREMSKYSFESMSNEMFRDELCREINMLERSTKEACEVYPFRSREYFADRIRRAHIEGGGMYLIRKQGHCAAEGFIATGEEDGESVIMDVVGRKENKEEMVKDFMRWQERGRIKEYVFPVMVKLLKKEVNKISKVGINDEI